MPVPDETNNFATHGKAPIPSNANGSFVVPHDREANPRHERPKLDSLPNHPATAPQVVAAPTAGSALGISMPSPTATMASPQATPVSMSMPPQQIIPQSPDMLQQQMAQQQFMQQQMAQQQQMRMQQMPMQQQVMPQQQMMPQQMMPQAPMQQQPQMMPQQMQMQQMPMQHQVMPQQQMMPQQPVQQMVQLPAGAQQISPNQIVMTPAQIAEMQAQIMAKALLSSQSQIFHRQKQTYKRSEEEPEPEYTGDDEPEQKDIRDQAPAQHEIIEKETHGERVIQPIHDVTREQQRDDMSRRMTELLGDMPESEPVAVNTKTAKQIKQGKVQAPGSAQSSETIAMTPEQMQAMEAERAAQIRASQPKPTDLFPEYSLSGERIEQPRPSVLATQRQAEAAQQSQLNRNQIYTSDPDKPRPDSTPSEQQEFVEQSYHSTPQSSHDITSRMDAPQLQSQDPSQSLSMDPRLAAIQQQQLMLIERQKMLQKEEAEQAAEARRLKEEAEQIERQREEEARQKAAAQQQAAAAQTNGPKELNPNRKSIRVNAEVVKKAALATILRRPTPPPVEEIKPVDPIRPAYVAELEEQLANDMKKDSGSEIAAKMAAELADDEITKNAQQIQSESPTATPEKVVEAMPEEVLRAIENANPTNPNIASSIDEQPSIDNTVPQANAG